VEGVYIPSFFVRQATHRQGQGEKGQGKARFAVSGAARQPRRRQAGRGGAAASPLLRRANRNYRASFNKTYSVGRGVSSKAADSGNGGWVRGWKPDPFDKV
jgi:hypothetical protein